jgi:hypothetical protein
VQLKGSFSRLSGLKHNPTPGEQKKEGQQPAFLFMQFFYNTDAPRPSSSVTGLQHI